MKAVELRDRGGFDGMHATVHLPEASRRTVSINAVPVGSRSAFEALVHACEANDIHPVVDRTFALEDHRAAFEHMAAGRHRGKVAITPG